MPDYSEFGRQITFDIARYWQVFDTVFDVTVPQLTDH